MREILFRGKRESDGKWLYGLYSDERVHETDFPCIFPLLEMDDDGDWAVLPETVGQYTGLTDKNGKKIFEGDVVTDRYANNYTPIFQNGIYMAYNPKDIKLKKAEPSTQFNIIWRDGCEVIGNIHDNPELLEV